MKGVTQKLFAMGISMNQNVQENKNKMFGRLEGSRIKKRGFWVCFSNKTKKWGKFVGCKDQLEYNY